MSLLSLQSRESPLQAPSLIAREDPQLDVIMDVRRNAAPLPRHKRKLSTGFRCAAAAAARLLVIRADPPGKRMRATVQTWGKTEFQRSRRRLPSLFVLGSIHALDVLNPAQSPPPHLRVDDTCQIKHGGGGGPSGSERSRRSNARQIRKTYFFCNSWFSGWADEHIRTCALVSTASAS